MAGKIAIQAVLFDTESAKERDVWTQFWSSAGGTALLFDAEAAKETGYVEWDSSTIGRRGGKGNRDLWSSAAGIAVLLTQRGARGSVC